MHEGETVSVKWYYQIMGEVVGPLNATELQEHARQGRITPDTFIRRATDGQWVSAERVKGLFDQQLPDSLDTTSRRLVPEQSNRATAIHDVGIQTGQARSKHPIRLYSLIGVIGLIVLVVCFWFLRPVSRERLVARAEVSVALIRGNLSQGTGFLIDSSLLVTNQHVIALEPDSQVKVMFPSDERTGHEWHSVRVVYESPDTDLAILELEERRQYLPLASSHKFTRGQEVMVIGNPGRGDQVVLENAVSRGILSTTTQINGNEYYQLDISINPGNSGGPVLDESGSVIGVVTLKATEREGMGFCIPLADLTGSVNTAKRLNQEDKEKYSSMHNLRAVIHLVAAAGAVYKLAMAAYVDSMNSYIESGSSAERGLSAVQPAVDQLVSEYNDVLIGKIESEVSRLANDPNVPEYIRQQFIEAWTNYKELKSYVENPRGSLMTYQAKYHELADEHDRLMESLRLLTGEHK